MTQLKSQYEEVKVSLEKMSFTPDIPSSQTRPTEYDYGSNVETDIRGMRSVAGTQMISSIPSSLNIKPLFVTSGFTIDNNYTFVVCGINYSTGNAHWYSTHDMINYTNIDPIICPGYSEFIGTYTIHTNITCVWNGNVLIINDTLNPPFFMTNPTTNMTMYSNQVTLNYSQINILSSVLYCILPNVTPTNTQFYVGQQVTLTNTPTFDGTYTIVSLNIGSIGLDITGKFTGYSGTYTVNSYSTISPLYQWNYLNAWQGYTANFIRMYNTPNVGSILVAGNLTAQVYTTGSSTTTQTFPVTVQWSQAFGLNQVPLTWAPTITNVANQLEVPLRGPAQDGFGSNGQFFISSYWDTVVLSPLNYNTTSSPILGCRLYSAARGLLTSNCYVVLDNYVYGVDSRDFWVFDGTNFTNLGNQRVKNYFFDQINTSYYDQVYLQANTKKNQVEVYYPDSNAENGICNKMLSYRYDLDCFNSPRNVYSAISATEAPIYTMTTLGAVNNIIASIPNLSQRCVVILYHEETVNNTGALLQKDIDYTNTLFNTLTNTWVTEGIISEFYRSNVKLLPNYSGKLMIHRVLPELVNLGAIPNTNTNNIQIYNSTGNLTLEVSGQNSAGQTPSATIFSQGIVQGNTDNPWMQADQNNFRLFNIDLYNTETNIWYVGSLTFQYTQVGDDR